MPSRVSAESVQLVYDSHLFENDLQRFYNKTLIGTAPCSTLVLGFTKTHSEIDNHPIKNLDRRDNKNHFNCLKISTMNFEKKAALNHYYYLMIFDKPKVGFQNYRNGKQ
jgi:hypothetical protein